MLFHLKWSPRDIKDATLYDLNLACEACNEFYGAENKTDLTKEDIERLKKLK